MSGQINLREIFEREIRNSLITYLQEGPLQGWDYKIVLQLIDEAIKASKGPIDSYLYQQNVTLLNMKQHITRILNEILIPYLNSKRVK